MAGWKREQNNRNCGDQPDESERECRVGSLVQLPSECHLQHLPAHDAEHPSDQKKPEVAEPESCVRVVRDCYVRSLVVETSLDPGGVGCAR